MTTLPLSEVFGPTWQGEGPHAGRLCSFVRLGLCNLSCSWCDTPYTWDTSRFDVKAECPDTEIAEIHRRLAATSQRLVVLSGGEPLMHHQRLEELLAPEPWEWHVETNGTIPPPDYWWEYVTHTTISPKVATDDPLRKRIKHKAIEAWAEYADSEGGVAWKFVVTDPRQLDEIAMLRDLHGIWDDHIWIMPEGTLACDVIAHHRALEPHILAHGWNTTTRLHTLLHNDERGH